MTNEFSNILGKQGKDKVTGFKGTITGVACYLTGCNQYLLAPKVKKDGSRVDGHWFDETRIEISNVKAIALKNEKPGPDQPAPIK